MSSRRRLPVTIALLRQVKAELAGAADILPSDTLMLWSPFTLAFDGFLNTNEFTSPSTTQFNPSVHLCCNNVSFISVGCISVHLKSSKTDPYQQGCTLLIAPSHRSVCAVRAFCKYLSLRSVNGSSPLYQYNSGLYLTQALYATDSHRKLLWQFKKGS